MVNRFSTVMCAVAVCATGAQAQQMEQPQPWQAKEYKKGDLIEYNNQIWECAEWPWSEFCSIINPEQPHRWVAWRGFQMPNVTECQIADSNQNKQYSIGDKVCPSGSNLVFVCNQQPCNSSDLVESNYNVKEFWWRWQLVREQGMHNSQDDDNNQQDDSTEPEDNDNNNEQDDNSQPDDNDNDNNDLDDNSDPQPNPSGEYWKNSPDKLDMPEDGPWTGGDWVHQQSGLKVENGVVSGITDEAKQRIRSNGIQFPIPLVHTDQPESNPENVQRAMRVLSREDWEYLVPLRLDFYTYDDFMQGLAAFPGICSDRGEGYAHLALDEVCEREMATLFAHFSQEVGAHWSGTGGIQEEWRQSLYLRSEEWCTSPNWAGDFCNYYPTWDEWSIKDNAYPRRDSSQSYHGRGPLQLSWNYQYGPFSKQLFGDQFVLLDNPDRIVTDGHGVEAWLAAFWFYSTPQPPKPSMHEVATGLWMPNQADLNAGNFAGFGQTTNIINGAIECGYANSQKANWRQEYYHGTADYFNADIGSNEVTNCEGTNTFSGQGSANQQKHYFDQRWDGVRQCQPVNWMTPYSVYTEGDYKRCVEHFYS